MGALAEIIAEVLLLESTLLRAEKMAVAKPLAIDLAKYYAPQSFRTVETSAECVLGTVAEGDDLRAQMATFRALSQHEPANTAAIGRRISAAMVEAGQYAV